MISRLEKAFILGKTDLDYYEQLKMLAAWQLSTDKKQAENAEKMLLEIRKGTIMVNEAKKFLLNSTIGNIVGGSKVVMKLTVIIPKQNRNTVTF